MQVMEKRQSKIREVRAEEEHVKEEMNYLSEANKKEALKQQTYKEKLRKEADIRQ